MSSSKAFHAENPANYAKGWINLKDVSASCLRERSHKFMTTQGEFLTFTAGQILSICRT